ncbi:MAG: class I SAM-dependent methyltransferase, partial [Bacteroidota bacterium]
MDWKSFWDKHAASDNTLQQVGRTGYDAGQMNRLMQEQAAYVAEKTGLTPQSVLLDVCCGNGVFTNLLTPFCKETVGLDLSPELIRHAISGKKLNQDFFVADLLLLKEWSSYEQYLHSFDAITLCFSFQYFETVEKGFVVIENLLPLLKSGRKILLTDIPDRARFFNHYNKMSKIAGLIIQMAKGKNVMGKF